MHQPEWCAPQNIGRISGCGVEQSFREQYSKTLKLIFLKLLGWEAAQFLNSPRHICKGCPLPCCQPVGLRIFTSGLAAAKLLWLGQGEGREISWWRSLRVLLSSMCRHRPVHPCQQQAQGSATANNGTQLVHAAASVYLTLIHPWHSTTPGLAMTTAQQHPAQLWLVRTTTQQQWERNRTGLTRSYALCLVTLLRCWSSSDVVPMPGQGHGPRGSVFTPLSHVSRVSSTLEVSSTAACVPDNQELGCAGRTGTTGCSV